MRNAEGMSLLASQIVLSLSELVDGVHGICELGGGGVHAGGLAGGFAGGGGVDLELAVGGGDFLEVVVGEIVVFVKVPLRADALLL